MLVTGGSQGALAINRAVEGALASGAWPPQAQLLWQTGSATFDEFRVLARPGQIIVQPFIDPFDAALAAADLVISRAGAMTLAEVSAWGLASVLIPLPSSAAGHQHANAEALARADAAVLLEQREASGTALGSLVAQLVSAPARLAHMGDAARDPMRRSKSLASRCRSCRIPDGALFRKLRCRFRLAAHRCGSSPPTTLALCTSWGLPAPG